MGGEAFYDITWIEDPKEAFSKLRSQAQYDYGHAGYTGTIAEKTDFEIRQQNPMTQSEAKLFIYGSRDNGTEGDQGKNDKYGPAFAVPLCREIGGPIGGWAFYGWASA